MPGLIETDTFSTTDISASIEVASFTAPAAGWFSPSLRVDGLDTSGRQTLTVALVINDGTNDHPAERVSGIKAADADTRYQRQLPAVWLAAADVLKVYLESSEAGDTSVGGSVRFVDAGNPVDAVVATDSEGLPLNASADVWASPSGTGGGLSRSDPASLDDAVTALQQGQTLRLLAGTYTIAGFSSFPSLAGKGGARIVGEGDAADVVVSGDTFPFDLLSLVSGVTLERLTLTELNAGFKAVYGISANRVKLRGMICNGPYDGIRLDVCHQAEMIDCQVTSNYDAFALSGRNVLVERCYGTTAAVGAGTTEGGVRDLLGDADGEGYSLTIRDSVLEVRRADATGATNAQAGVEVGGHNRVWIEGSKIISESEDTTSDATVYGIRAKGNAVVFIRETVIKTAQAHATAAEYSLIAEGNAVIYVDRDTVDYDESLASGDIRDMRTYLPTTGDIEQAMVDAGDGTNLLQLIADKIATDLTDTDATALAIATATRDLILNRVLAGNHDTAGTAGKLLQFLDAAISSVDGTGDVSVIRAVLAGKRSLTDNGNGTKTARFLDTDGVTAKLDLTFDAAGQITASEEDPA